MPRRLDQGREVPHPVRAGHPVRDLHVERLGREAHAVAVAVDEIGGLERGAQRRLLLGLVEYVRVDVHHPAGPLAAADPARDAAQQVVGAGELHRDVEDARLRALCFPLQMPGHTGRVIDHHHSILHLPARDRLPQTGSWRT